MTLRNASLTAVAALTVALAGGAVAQEAAPRQALALDFGQDRMLLDGHDGSR